MSDDSQGAKCGGYTHEIIYISGPIYNSNLAPINADLSTF